MADEAEMTISLQKLAFKTVDSLYVPGRNLVYSPASLAFALGMVLEGADGQSRKEILDLMLSPGHDNDDQSVEKVSDFLTKLLHGDPDGVLKLLNVSNSFYAEKKVLFNENFVTTLKDKYKASVRCLDFVNAGNQAVIIIHRDVEKATNGMISNFFDHIESDTVSLIVNAMYFKGKWQDQFDKSFTKMRDFHLSNGKKIKVSTMKMKKTQIRVNDSTEDHARILKLPYELCKNQDKDLVIFYEESGIPQFEQIYMVIVLPDDRNIKQYLSTFDANSFKRSLDNIYFEINATLTMPRFKIESPAMSLIPTMQQLGVSQIFTNEANFTKLTQFPILISDVSQKAIIEVDEEGTVAVAVTCMTFICKGGKQPPPPKPYIFRVDRPFIYMLIREDTHRERQILFLGVVENPLQN